MRNLGEADKSIRMVLALLIGVIGWVSGSYWGFIMIIPVLTVGINWCPIYGVFGINTHKNTKKNSVTPSCRKTR